MKRMPEMESETPLRPRAVAEAVWEEAGLWLGQSLPRRWLRELIAEANTVYAHNQRFRRKLRGNGNGGRDHLWMFARHWLAALLKERRSHLHRRLPASYNAGSPLPMKAAVPQHRNACARREVSLPARAVLAQNEGWMAAAHFHLD